MRGAVKLMAATVESLYVSSRPGPIELGIGSVFLAVGIGVGVAVTSAYSPAREASLVSPVEAMGKGDENMTCASRRQRLVAGSRAQFSCGCGFAGKCDRGKPLFGYLAAILLVGASALAIPAVADALLTISSKMLGKIFGVEALLASRSLAGSLRRTSVLVGALSTPSHDDGGGHHGWEFSRDGALWMGDQLPADLYLRPAGPPRGSPPTISLGLAEKIANFPE